MMFKPFTLIATGLIFWYSVESEYMDIHDLVKECFEKECGSTSSNTNDNSTDGKVCGVNGVIYDNIAALECASKCAQKWGNEIVEKPLGFCSDNPTVLDFY
ncbi:hypothetical protein WA026_023042 [Henosepilachna vigintioctopunctata]|uniref:Uncharacterized protein n=1 Tax=Henosepilachna vigintioctopunctata TaxID=420089 RepID=A0AAW1VJG6_9CUCU